MTGWTPPVPKPTDRADVRLARDHLENARGSLDEARALLLGAGGSFDAQKVVWYRLDPLLAQLADLDDFLRPWSA